MGQRHQIYVVLKSKNKIKPLGAFHHQWCYGVTAITSLTRAADLIRKNIIQNGKYENYSFDDERMIETVIKATYGVSLDGKISIVHNESEYLIHDDTIKPENGDNNDGCSLILIDDDNQQIKVGFFTPHHLEGKYGGTCKPFKIYSRYEYLNFYYSDKDQAEPKFIASFIKELELITSTKEFGLISSAEFDLILGKTKIDEPKVEKPKAEKPTVKRNAKLLAFELRMERLKK